MPRKKKKAQPTVVIDASVTLAWCFHDEADPYADAIAKKFKVITALVPVIWTIEVANAFLIGERRKRSTQVDTANWIAFLSGLPITVDHHTNTVAWTEILSLGRSHNLSAYDAAYLELALRRDLPLATLDDKLKRAGMDLGIPPFTP